MRTLMPDYTLGAEAKPEEKTREAVPLDLLRQLSDITSAHDRLVKDLPGLRAVHLSSENWRMSADRRTR